MLIASTDDIITSSLFNYSYSSISFRSDAWTMNICEYFIERYMLIASTDAIVTSSLFHSSSSSISFRSDAWTTKIRE